MVMQSIIALEWHHRNVGHGVTLTALDATMINFSRYKSCFPIFLGYGFLQEKKKNTLAGFLRRVTSATRFIQPRGSRAITRGCPITRTKSVAAEKCLQYFSI